MSEGLKVMLVEDDADTRANIRDILELDGHKTTMCDSCQAALKLLEQHQCSAAIIDWKLPDGDADQLIPQMMRYAPELPIIVVTGYRELDTSISALRAGAYDYIIKPINADVLRSTLKRIEERRDHLRQIEFAQSRLLENERLAAIGEMVAGLAHESRNALQRSQACLEALALDLEDRPDSLQLVHRIERALHDLHALYEQVRDYAAPINLELERCDIADLVSETWQQLQMPGKSAVELVVDCDSDCCRTAEIDSDRMRQVFRNLLENGRQACNGGGKINIHLQQHQFRNQPGLKMDVKDTGEGISPEFLGQIFQPFFTTKTKGTGLGLAISRRIVEAHHGGIYLNTNEAGGARFTILLPLQQPH